MRISLAASLLALAFVAAAHADDTSVTLSVQTGYRKCFPAGQSVTNCRTKLSDPANVTIPTDGINQTTVITADDQTFQANVSITPNGGYNYSMFVYFDNGNRTLTYSSGAPFEVFGQLTLQDVPTFVKRSDFESDSYEPIIMVGPAVLAPIIKN